MAYSSRHCLVLPFELPFENINKKIVLLLRFSIIFFVPTSYHKIFFIKYSKFIISSKSTFNVFSDGINFLI